MIILVASRNNQLDVNKDDVILVLRDPCSIPISCVFVTILYQLGYKKHYQPLQDHTFQP